jgi:SpoVK/Ycf46/Vps4 family AAA+-type ATPase
LVEINSHSLFSKWFSESGKLVQKLFARVTEMVEDESGFVVVLIDEVESLTAARAGAMSGTEPSDALRVSYKPGMAKDSKIQTLVMFIGRQCPSDATRQAQASEKRAGHVHLEHRPGDR